ncbi:hypothetical protein [Burkholderia sp. AU45388]|uniref:hypothetical protein n=1 Tax=Burkholderia sp. AU45388 TaxID=3059206 RepID=UPI00264D3F95|nr:hypothetical protein [Burkholderia sp. AU45388]MDN7429069.1 hypothetical protein [Burkholderia sp. AU45388]
MASLLSTLSKPLKNFANRGGLSFLPSFRSNHPWHACTIENEYVQRLVIGVQAASREQARQLVERAYHLGTLLEDTDKMPILSNAFEPVRVDGPLQLSRIEELDEQPEPDGSVMQMKYLNAAPAFFRFAQLITELCQEADDTPAGAPDPRYIGIDVPTDKLREIAEVLNGIDF